MPTPKNPTANAAAVAPNDGRRAPSVSAKNQVHAAGDQTLDQRNHHRIGRRQFARQVVVDAPGETGRGDHDPAFINAQPLPSP